MIAVDTNILVHAHRSDSEWHEQARAALERLDHRPERWAIPWPCVYEFYSIVTHRKIFDEPTPSPIAWEALAGFFSSASVILLAEDSSSFQRVRSLLHPLNLRGARIHDGRIAAICHLNGVDELWSQDRDFSRFGFLKVVNPLVA